jgi:hypothetical protein
MSDWYQDGYQTGEKVIRKCGLSKAECLDVKWYKQAYKYIIDNLEGENEVEWLRGFEDGADDAIKGLQ